MAVKRLWLPRLPLEGRCGMKVHATICYEKLKPIGVGQGMNSEVFLVQDAQTGGQLAVKEVEKAKLGTTPTDYYREAQAMFAACRSNVVEIQFACETPTHICLAMPYYKNGSLADRIEAGPLPLREAIRIGIGVLTGLAHVHTAGFVHFDIKPSNVLFSDTDVPLIADFGQTRSIGPSGLATVPPMYPFALPPEYFSHSAVSPASDVYQLGLTLYRVVNGDPYFNSQKPPATLVALEAKTLAGTFPDRSSYLPHIPKALRRIIKKALSIDPANRYQSATEFADALGKVEVNVDWSVSYPNGELHWQATRDGQPDWLVCLISAAAGDYRVEVYTVNALGARRAKGRADLWRSQLTFDEAELHLSGIFEQLT